MLLYTTAMLVLALGAALAAQREIAQRHVYVRVTDAKDAPVHDADAGRLRRARRRRRARDRARGAGAAADTPGPARRQHE